MDKESDTTSTANGMHQQAMNTSVSVASSVGVKRRRQAKATERKIRPQVTLPSFRPPVETNL
jgi:hypothetical protein